MRYPMLPLFAVSVMLAAPVPKLKPVTVEAPPATTEAAPASKTVYVTDRDVVTINTRLRFTTVIILPMSEVILDFLCGDKEFWVINGIQNYASIRPTMKEHAVTNLNLMTASGKIYSFLLQQAPEGIGSDLKVFIEPKDSGGALSASLGKPRFVTAEAVDDYREQLEIAKAETAKVKAEAEKQIAAEKEAQAKALRMAKAALPGSLKYDYEYKDRKPFNVASIAHDDKFTYIKANPTEAPIIGELKDGKYSVIQYQYDSTTGLYTIPKVIDRFFFGIGKLKLHVTRKS